MDKVAPFPVVGVGASAGGLRALESFFGPLPANPGMAFVIITHLAPDRESLLTEILARHSAMPAEVAQDGLLVEPNKVYAPPPNAILTMSEGRLRLRAGDPAHHERAPIDIFFRSLAQDCGEYAVGVVLSGSGSDGAIGVRAIKELGGVTLAQAADASGPGFADMPDSAIASGVIDFAVPIDAMAAKLIDNALSFDALDELAREPAPGDDDRAAADARQAISAILRAQTGHKVAGRASLLSEGQLRQMVEARVLDRFSAPHVVVNGDSDIVYFSSRAGKYFEAPVGAPTRQGLFATAHKDLRLDLQSALREAISTHRSAIRDCVALETDDHRIERVSLIVEPISDRLVGEPLFLIVFEENDHPEPSSPSVAACGQKDNSAEHERELLDRRERLQNTIEEYETALEELRLSNEELVSLNEEMQSVNEEMQTVNHELGAKIEELDRANADLTNLFASSQIATIFLDNNLVIRSFTPAVTQLFNIQSSDRGRSLCDFTFKLDYPGLQDDIKSVLSTGEPKECRTNKGDNAAHYLARLIPYRYAKEKIDGVVVTFVDMTSIVRSGELADQLASVAAALPGALYSFRVGADGRQTFPYAAPKMKEVCGFGQDELAVDAAPLFARINADDLKLIIARREVSTRELAFFAETFRYDHPQKGMVWLEANSTPVRESDGIVVWHGFFHDVTARKRAANELEESEERLRAVIDGAGDGIITIDDVGIIRSVNRAGLRMFGFAREEMLGQNVCMLMPEPDRSEHDGHVQGYKGSSESRIIGVDREILGQRKDGSLFPMALTVSEAQYDDSHLFVGFARDLSHQRRIEAQIERLNSERLTAMQGMAAGLAHEINQPLAAGVMYLKAARRLLKMPHERQPASVEDTLDQAAEAMLRAGQIMNRLRDFVSGGDPDKSLRRLHELVQAVCKKMTEEGRLPNIELTLELNAGNDRVAIDPIQISQVLINLIRNAAQAMKTSKTRRLIVSTVLQGKDMICVSVDDTGCGLSDEVRKTLFEPFRTTKETGVGIGLSISRSIVEAHYGKIWAEPNPLGGTLFKFNLPLAEDEVS